MECYEGATMIKTYRGLIADGGQDHIRLKTNRGDIGYRIVKFETIGPDNNTTFENVLKIYKLKQSTIDVNIDFTDGDILAATLTEGSSASGVTGFKPVIFDKEIFNQDIYITNSGTTSINYYLELEQVKLNENESTMATLQSLRRFALPRN
jgi:hypothetical protein